MIADTIACGEIRFLPLATDQEAEIELTPARSFDFGTGKGKKLVGKVKGGVVGLVLDARGRPITIANDEGTRVQQLQTWAQAVELYSNEE